MADWSSFMEDAGTGSIEPAAEPAPTPSIPNQWDATMADTPRTPTFQPPQSTGSYWGDVGREFSRSGEFMKGALSDIPEEWRKATQPAFQRLTDIHPAKTWGETAAREASRLGAGVELAGTLNPIGAAATTLRAPVGHLLATGAHAVGSLTPEIDKYDVPDTSSEPMPGGKPFPLFPNPITEAGHVLRGEPTESLQWGMERAHRPHASYSEFGLPAATVAPAFMGPKGVSPSATRPPMKGLPGQQPEPIKPPMVPPTSERLQEVALDQLNEAHNLGVQFHPKSMNKLADSLVKDTLLGNNFDPKDFPPVVGKINELRKATTVAQVRGVMGRLANIPNEKMWPAVNAVKHGIMDYLGNLTAADFTAPTADAGQKLPGLLNAFRQNYAIGARAKELEGVENEAVKGSQSLFTRRKDVGEELAKSASKMSEDPRATRYMTDQQKQTLQKVYQGTWPTRIAARIGRFAPELPGEHGTVLTPGGLFKDAAYGVGSAALPFLSNIESLPSWLGAPVATATKLAEYYAHGQPTKQWHNLIEQIRASAPAAATESRINTPLLKKQFKVPAAALAHQLAQQYNARGSQP